MNGSELLVELLLEQGVTRIFGYPGGAVLNIFDALYRYQDKLQCVLTAHEQGASHAADGYARLTGRTGVVLATSGPGATNLVTGIATAFMDSVPLVAITGNVGTSLIGRDSFQEVYIAGITMPVTKHNFVVRHVEELAGVVRAAFAIAQEGRKGPVLIDIPKDVSAMPCAYTPLPLATGTAKRPGSPRAVARVAEVLNAARQPVIYFGGGVQAAGAGDLLLALCQKADIPATHTLMAAGVLGCDEAHNLGLIGMHGNLTANKAVHEADVLLIAGARLSDRVALNPAKFAPNAKKIHVDVDAAEIDKNVRVDDSIVGDVQEIFAQLLPLTEEKRRPAWAERIAAWKSHDYSPKDDATRLRPHQIMRGISRLAGEDAIYVTDVGQHQLWAAQYARHLRPRHFLTSGGLGTMGFGYGAAIGAALAACGRPVVHITSDGSLHMNMNEACTAVRYNVPVITVIFNNAVLGMVRQWQTVFYGGRYACTDPQRKSDYVKLAEGFGMPGFRCANPAEFEAAFAQALANARGDGPRCCWIECLIDKDEKVLPMIPAGGSVEDMMMD
ncbi:MAG: biosynthetic-type acetolactate synthase large subunit [Oscillospiraceae bacterium]|jgi:acetolactate synthase-1/2/3 large subunit|nr:biosynthetic-type acetolactate synthase large subunit [Oscillospiraceae bacterium]